MKSRSHGNYMEPLGAQRKLERSRAESVVVIRVSHPCREMDPMAQECHRQGDRYVWVSTFSSLY